MKSKPLISNNNNCSMHEHQLYYTKPPKKIVNLVNNLKIKEGKQNKRQIENIQELLERLSSHRAFWA